MRRVKCYDCGKRYDYDEDAFCPNCGAFNQPRQNRIITADGTIKRVDGLNEQNHVNSFVHEEMHAENRERKGTALEAGKPRRSHGAQPSRRVTPVRQIRPNLAGAASQNRRSAMDELEEALKDVATEFEKLFR